MGHGRRRGQKAYERQPEPSQIGSTKSNGRQPWCSGWRYVPYLRYVQGRQGMKEGGRGGRCGGAKRRWKNNFEPPWKTRGKLKGAGGAGGRLAYSRTATRREGKSGWVIGILGRRRATPRWANDLMWQSEILGRRQGTPRWVDEPVWWLCQVLVELEGLGSIHNYKQHSLGFEQSLTEAWKTHLIIQSHCLPPGYRSTHTHTSDV